MTNPISWSLAHAGRVSPLNTERFWKSGILPKFFAVQPPFGASELSCWTAAGLTCKAVLLHACSSELPPIVTFTRLLRRSVKISKQTAMYPLLSTLYGIACSWIRALQLGRWRSERRTSSRNFNRVWLLRHTSNEVGTINRLPLRGYGTSPVPML